MDKAIYVIDSEEAYNLIVDYCAEDIEASHDNDGMMNTCLSLSYDDTTTVIEVGYYYMLNVDYDCDTNTYAIMSVQVKVTDIDVTTFDINDYEMTTGFTRELMAINKKKLAYDIIGRMDTYNG